jgi:tetratricopeptide (TPR) repeat protein
VIWLLALYLGTPRAPPGPILSRGSDILAAAPAPPDDRAGAGAEATRQDRFLYLLRTYPERPPADTFRQVAALVDEGDFAERARAEYWIGAARLAAGDRAGARAWFARLAHDYPGSVWEERSWIGLGDAAAQERDYGAALAFYARAQDAGDGAVRELSRIDAGQARILRRRQRIAWAAGAVAALIAALFAFGAFKARLRPLPAETQIILPVLAVLALLSLRVDPAPRVAILELCAGGALLSLLSGLRLRALAPGLVARLLHAALGLAALGCIAYVAVYRADLIGMVQETFRGGPE